MSNQALETMRSFDQDHIPDLDTVVMGALELFTESDLPDTTVPFRRPLVIGSAGAAAASRILFASSDAIFADESTFESALARVPDIDGAVVVSASGGKHSVEIAKTLKEKGVGSVLFTNNPNAPAAEYFALKDVRVFPKNREPYTYNTSTYLGMVLADTKEKAAEIKAFIDITFAGLSSEDFASFSSYVFILPPEFGELRNLLRIKFDELFGAKVPGRFFTTEEIKHAKTVVPDDGELFVSIGVSNTSYGDPGRRIYVPLPEKSGYAAAMAVSYYTVGLIQRSKPAYFKENIVRYCLEASATFGQKIEPIVE